MSEHFPWVPVLKMKRSLQPFVTALLSIELHSHKSPVPYMSFHVLGVFCDPADCSPHGKCIAPYCRTWPPNGMWSHGWPRRFPDIGPGQTPGVQFAEEIEVELHVHAGGVA